MHWLGLLLLFLWPSQALPASLSVDFKQSAGEIEILVGGQPFSTFYFGPQTTKPYLHPLRAADGTIVTRRYPMEEVAGEQYDHPHHRGLWFTHGDVNGFDFWANEPGQEPVSAKGRVRLKKVIEAASHTGAAGVIRALFDWVTPQGKMLVAEDRTMTFRGDASTRTVDFDITLTAQQDKVTFGDTKEGTFAIRLATPLEEPHDGAKGVRRTGRIVSSEGRAGEAQAWGKRAKWVDYSGEISGNGVGVAIFDHPANPKHPTYWHVRSYGLFAANVFGEHDFHADASRDGSLTLARGETLRFRYRVVIHTGDTAGADVAGRYEDWASAVSR